MELTGIRYGSVYLIQMFHEKSSVVRTYGHINYCIRYVEGENILGTLKDH